MRVGPLGLVLVLLALAVAIVVPDGIRAAADRPFETVLWVVFLSAAGLVTVPMLPRFNIDVSLSATITVAAAMVLPTSLAALVALVALTSERELQRGVTPLAVVFNHSQIALATGAASFVGRIDVLGVIPATAAAVLTYNVVNVVAIAAVLMLRRSGSLPHSVRQSADPFPRFWLDFLLVGSLALFVVVAYEQVGVWAVLLLAMPLWLGYSALRSARESEDRAEELALRVRELEALNELGERLLAVRSPEEVAHTTERALQATLENEAVTVALDGKVGDGLEVVPVPGGEPAAIGVPADLSERSSAVVEATAGLAGMVLQRTALERELAENEKALSRLAERILEEGNHERSRIALELHDAVLPYFAAAQIQVDNVRTALEVGASERADQLAVTTHDAVQDGIARLRGVLDAIRDQILVPGGLREGLQAALADLDLKHGIDAHLEADDLLPPMPLAVETLVLETVRGCLGNVARHAGAARVGVDVAVRDGMLCARVEDDGVGFDPEEIGPGHHGLALMTQRVELARGRLRIDSVPGKGTRVDLEVPV